jgi:hypothetical protein
MRGRELIRVGSAVGRMPRFQRARTRPHGGDEFGNLGRIGDRQRTGLADTDESRARGAGRDLGLRWMVLAERIGRRRAQHDPVEEG